jgi:dienelactone hydrolase
MKLSVGSKLSLADEPPGLTVEGAPPGAQVTIRTETVDQDGLVWRAEARFNADNRGRVDAGAFAPSCGDYEGVDAHGLIWSVKPLVPPGATALPPTYPNLTPEARQPWRATATAGRLTAEVAFERTWVAPGVAREEVADGRLRGVHYQPPEAPPQSVAVLVVAGSGGGVSESLAPLIASHGYPTFALAYFGYADLAPALHLIPLEYFEEAARWLRRRAGVERVVMVGISRGSEAVSLSAANFEGLADGVVLYVPSHVVEGGRDPETGLPAPTWTLRGDPLDFAPLPPSGLPILQAVAKISPQPLTPVYLEKWIQPEVETTYGIPFERIGAPILLLSAGDDAMWPSWIAAARAAARLEALGLGKSVRHVCYQGAGHVISRPGLTMSMSTVTHHQLLNLSLALGGLPRLNALAALDALSLVLAFVSGVGAGVSPF